MKKIALLGALLLFSTAISAQIEGDITDNKEKPVPAATVTATDSSGKVVATVKADSRGFYAFYKLAKGKYKVEVKAAGYKTAIFENVEVKVEPGSYDEMDDVAPGPRLDIVLMPENTSAKIIAATLSSFQSFNLMRRIQAPFEAFPK